MLEVVQSMYLIRQGDGKILAGARRGRSADRVKKKLPKGEAYLETEAPKGQMGFMIISDGTPVPWRVRIRSSSFCNLSVMPELVPRRVWWPTFRRSSARWIWCWGRLIGEGVGDLGIWKGWMKRPTKPLAVCNRSDDLPEADQWPKYF